MTVCDGRRDGADLLFESIALGLMGGLLGLVVAQTAIGLVARFTLPGNIALSAAPMGVDARVVAFALGLSLVTAIGFGLWPAIRATRPALAATLGNHSRRASGRAPRGILLGAQIAISLILVTGSLLFLRSVRAGLMTDVGFHPERLAAATMSPAMRGANETEAMGTYSRALDRARAIPGVQGAALSSHVPLERLFTLPLVPVGAAPGTQDNAQFGFVSVSPGFFAVMGVRIIDGRDIVPSDAGARNVVINELAASAYWPGRSADGRQLSLFGKNPYTVVGVVANTRYESLEDRAVPVAYASIDAEQPTSHVTLVVRAPDPAAILPGLRASIIDADPLLPAVDVRPVSAQISRALMPQRFGATLLSVVAIVAVAICLVGLYGTIGYTVSRRTSEIGIRSALGAQHLSIIRLVLGQTSAVVAAGCGAGLAGSVVAGQAIRHFLYGVSPLDVLSLVGGVLILTLGALLVALAPLRRALRIDPAEALRHTS